MILVNFLYKKNSSTETHKTVELYMTILLYKEDYNFITVSFFERSFFNLDVISHILDNLKIDIPHWNQSFLDCIYIISWEFVNCKCFVNFFYSSS